MTKSSKQIPFPELPLPANIQMIATRGRNKPMIQVSTPQKISTAPILPLLATPTKAELQVEEVNYPQNQLIPETDEDKVKDMGKYVVEPIEWPT